MSFFFFSKLVNRNIKQVLSGGWYQWEGRGRKERVKEGECGGNIVNTCMKTEK
jgi:hypothetical protein